MKTVVIYKSKSGYTKTYAQWIAEELNCDLKENDGLKLQDIQDYDTIIYGGGIYASGISGIKLINKNYDALKDKNIIVWATGSAPDESENNERTWAHNFSELQLAHIKTFYIRGGFNYRALSNLNKVLMSGFRKALQKQKELSDGMNEFLDKFNEPQDYREKENIKPLVEYVMALK